VDQRWQENLQRIRQLAVNGEFSAARKQLLGELRQSPPAGKLRDALSEQGRTLEVLEAIDVLSRLLRDEDTAGAARAADTILEALSADEYARVGIIGAALSLVGRAESLARKAEESGAAPEVRRQLQAFVTLLDSELDELGRENVQRPLEALLRGEDAGQTLSDLLSRRPWQGDRSSALETVPEPARSSRQSASVPATVDPEGSPVIGRILIEQEERERVSAVPQPAASGSGDLLELTLKAATEHWYIVMGMALLFALFGYLGVSTQPDRYESTALLQKTQQSSLRAPITNRPSTYLPSLPPKTVLELVKLPTFHGRVSARLAGTGWRPEESAADAAPEKLSVDAATIANALTVSVDDTGNNTYMIRFSAVHESAETARAIAGAASEEFRRVHFEHVTSEAAANLSDYEKRQGDMDKRLADIHAARLKEFEISEVEVPGVSVADRIRELIETIESERKDRKLWEFKLTAAKDEKAAQQAIAARLPEFDTPERDERVQAKQRYLDELEREWYELCRKQSSYGEAHPIHQRIAKLHDDIELLKAEIAELEKSLPENLDKRTMNRDRAFAEDRVAKAASAEREAQAALDWLNERIPKLESELARMRDGYLDSETIRREEDELIEQRQRNQVVLEEIKAVMDTADRELALVSPASKAAKLPREVLLGIALGLVLGLAVGIGLAIALLRRRQLARHAEAA
jgi:hypothetical protein